MPRKPKPTWSVMKRTLELAVLHGKNNLTAIQRSLDDDLEKLRQVEGIATGDTPDTRTIKWIVNDYINQLSPEAVKEQLPPSVWGLREDYEQLKGESHAQSREYKGDMKQHYTELSTTGLVLASNLDSYLGELGTDELGTDSEVGDVVYGGWLNLMGGERDALSVEMHKVDKRIASNLLLHIKVEFPELTEIKDWAELADDKITKNFVERLRLKVTQGRFSGTCPGCLG
ncbi:MAG: hypothetical protein NTU41_00810 [Chloroflexi bacterium]|nr:hypothetical protein [Chloroflexota bacterium]